MCKSKFILEDTFENRVSFHKDSGEPIDRQHKKLGKSFCLNTDNREKQTTGWNKVAADAASTVTQDRTLGDV